MTVNCPWVMKKNITEPYTLVIIDMQYGFTASDSAMLHRNIKREINRAKRCDSDIIFVTYNEDTFGATFQDLVDHAMKGDYEYITHVEKRQSDGGYDVKEELSQDKKHHLKIVGVQTSVCVADTADTLIKLLPESKIEIIRECVRDYPYGRRSQSEAWEELIFRFGEIPTSQLSLRG